MRLSNRRKRRKRGKRRKELSEANGSGSSCVPRQQLKQENMRLNTLVCFLFHVEHVRLGKIMPKHIIAPLSPNQVCLISAFEC